MKRANINNKNARAGPKLNNASKKNMYETVSNLVNALQSQIMTLVSY